jgi:hypothetical protein
MILFPAMMVGGHLIISVVDRVPDLNFEPLCREAATGDLGIKGDFATCKQDETEARDQLGKQWSQFDAADRARCVRLSTTNRTASYVEVLTCLELSRDAKSMHKAVDGGIAVPEPVREPPPERGNQPTRSAVVAPPPAPPLPLTPPPASSGGLLEALCVPGLKAIVPACNPSGGAQ